MTRMHNKKQKSKIHRKANPIVFNRPNPRIRVNFDGQMLNGTGFMAPLVTLVNTAQAVYIADCSTTNVATAVNNDYQCINYDLTNISKYYNEYIYHSIHMEWVPYTSPGIADGGSQMYIAFIDNPEVISNAIGAAIPNVYTLAKTSRDMKFFNAWERFVYKVPLTRRHNTFDVNLTDVYAADTVDRSVQGAVLVGATSPSAGVSLGQFRVSYHLELRKLNYSLST